MTCYRQEDLKAYATALLQAGGYSAAHAERTADILVWANARGTNSHGVLRVPRYIEMVDEGRIDPLAEPHTMSSEGAVSVIEGAHAPGPSVMVNAMDHAIEAASRFGIGWCSARNITHAGAVGYFALRAAEKGYLGIVMTASGPLMAYHGARVSGVSTNPLSIAAPSKGLPLLLDMSTSTAALGKIMQAKDAGSDIPEGWAINTHGAPATAPSDVATLLPLGGPKGSGLSLMIEVLTSVLISNPVISTVLSGNKGAMNGAAVAIKIDAFAQAERFSEQVADLARSLRALPKAPDTTEILMPGERGFRLAAERMKTGIPIAEGTLRRLAALADIHGVAQPTAMPTQQEASPITN